VFDVPNIGYLHPVLVGEPEHFRPAFFRHTEGSFPCWLELVYPFSCLEPAEGQVSDLEGSWLYVALVVAAEGLLVASCLQRHSTPNLLLVENVLLPM